MRTVVSMFANAAFTGGATCLAALFLGAFFTFHYGLFCFGHGVFVMAMFGGNLHGDTILDLGAGVRALFAAQTNLFIGFLSIVAWQVVQFVIFIESGEVKRTTVADLMGAPYPRIIALHVTIIFGGFVLMLLNQPVAGIVVLALVKMAYDVGGVLRAPRPDRSVVEGVISAPLPVQPQ